MDIVLVSVLLGVASMFGYGLSTVFSKTIIQHYGAAKSVAIREVFVIVFCLLLAIPFLHTVESWPMFFLAILLGMVGYIPLLTFFKAIERSPIGIISPITSTAPIISIALSLVFLNISVNTVQWIGIGLIIITNVLISLSVKHSHNKDWLAGIPYAFITLVGWGTYFFLMIPVSRALGPWVTPLATEGGVLIASFLFLYITKQLPTRKDFGKPASVVLPAFLIFFGTAMYALASTCALPGIFSPISQSSGLVSIIFGAILFKEHLSLRQRILTVAMILGVVLLSLS